MSGDWRTGVEHALELAARGWKVVPYLDNPDGSQLKGWPELATTDPDEIERLWEPFPDAHVGVIPGLVGRACVDFDMHEGKPSGFDTAGELGLPTKAQVSFPSRSGVGRHLWYSGTGTSRPLYPGIDRKSLKGLVRVGYLLPDVEDVYEELPAVYSVHNAVTAERAYTGGAVEWMEAHAGRARSAEVAEALARLKGEFNGHDTMLRVQVHLVKLAGEGFGGVPEALAELKDRWEAAEHVSGNPQQSWTRGLVGAITAYGGEAPAPSWESQPEDFFDKTSLRTHDLGVVVSQGLALDAQQQPWVYRDGVYTRDVLVIDSRVNKLLLNKARVSHVNNVKSYVLTALDLPEISPTPNPDLINVRNGLFDWKTNELRPHDPEVLSTVQLPIEFDPAATCPVFDRWLAQVVPADSLRLAWEVIGYMCMSGNPLHSSVLLYGPGRNGKSTLLRLLGKLLGEHNTTNVTLRELTEGRFHVAELYGKLANIAGDIDSKYMGDAAMFKAITGQDRVSAERKGRDPFMFRPWAVPIFSANTMWASADTSEGYFSRWVVLSMPYDVRHFGPFDESELEPELAGIFNKAIANLRVLMERGHFEPPASAFAVMEEMRSKADSVLMWLMDEDSVAYRDAGNDTLRVSAPVAFSRYKAWCEDFGYKFKNRSSFKSSMEALGHSQIKSSGLYYTGLTLKELAPAKY